MIRRTRHLLYVDEAGTHDMKHIDSNWPVFVLVGLLVGETYYAKTLVPRIKEFKAAHGLATGVVLHSREIRRWEGPFEFLKDARLANRWLFSPNPYDVSLSQLLSLVCGPPGTPSPWRPNVVKIIAERRGKVEDKQLQAEYQGFRQHGLASYGAASVQTRHRGTVKRVFPSRVDFAAKSKVVAGLELVDLAAYPIGRAFVNRDWENPAYRTLAPKIRALVPYP